MTTDSSITIGFFHFLLFAIVPGLSNTNNPVILTLGTDVYTGYFVPTLQ